MEQNMVFILWMEQAPGFLIFVTFYLCKEETLGILALR